MRQFINIRSHEIEVAPDRVLAKRKHGYKKQSAKNCGEIICNFSKDPNSDRSEKSHQKAIEKSQKQNSGTEYSKYEGVQVR